MCAFHSGSESVDKVAGYLVNFLRAFACCAKGDAVVSGCLNNDVSDLLNVLVEAVRVEKRWQSFFAGSVFQVGVDFNRGRAGNFSELLKLCFFGDVSAGKIQFGNFLVNSVYRGLEFLLNCLDICVELGVAIGSGSCQFSNHLLLDSFSHFNGIKYWLFANVLSMGNGGGIRFEGDIGRHQIDLMGSSLVDERCWIEFGAIERFEYLIGGVDTLRTLAIVICDSGNGFAKLFLIGKGCAFFFDGGFYQSYLLGDKSGEFGAFVIQLKFNGLSYGNAVHYLVGDVDKGLGDFTAGANVTEFLGFKRLPGGFACVLDCGFADLGRE